MQWKGRRESSNVEDVRGRGRGGPRMAAGGSVGFIVIVLLVWALGGNPSALLQNAPPGGGLGGGVTTPYVPTKAEEQLASFVKVVLADTEDVWNQLLPREGTMYAEPTLVLFSGAVESACGYADSAVGPFYCGADERIYVDLSFYGELKDRFGAAGDFAQAYVIAHEVGHHVQHLLGISDQVHARRGRVSDAEYNRLSVRLELHADFLAGVWAHHAQKTKSILDPGDLEEALNAANAIGDDTLQRRAQGYVVPDSFTHGTSEQRVRWFRRGFETGDMKQGNTFETAWEDL